MSNIPARPLAALLVSCVLASAHVVAQTEPAPVTHSGITYVTGGIGEDEVRAFHEVAPRYNLRITLATKAGHYLSDVNVRIAEGQREVLHLRTEGPFLFVRLPAGHYKITARDRNLTETKQVVVPAKGGIDVHFYWDDPDRHGVMQVCRSCPVKDRQ